MNFSFLSLFLACSPPFIQALGSIFKREMDDAALSGMKAWREVKEREWSDPESKLRRRRPTRHEFDKWLDRQCRVALEKNTYKKRGTGVGAAGELSAHASAGLLERAGDVSAGVAQTIMQRPETGVNKAALTSNQV
jgi:hypothetical protein